jgi:hypothetical protein
MEGRRLAGAVQRPRTAGRGRGQWGVRQSEFRLSLAKSLGQVVPLWVDGDVTLEDSIGIDNGDGLLRAPIDAHLEHFRGWCPS